MVFSQFNSGCVTRTLLLEAITFLMCTAGRCSVQPKRPDPFIEAFRRMQKRTTISRVVSLAMFVAIAGAMVAFPAMARTSRPPATTGDSAASSVDLGPPPIQETTQAPARVPPSKPQGPEPLDAEIAAEGGGQFDLSAAEPTDPGVMTLSLQDCLRLALEQNMKIKAVGQEEVAARGQLTEAKAGFWPVIEYNYRVAPVPTDITNAFDSFFDGQVTLFNSFHVGIGVPLITFGQLHTAKKLAEGGVEAARINGEKARANVLYQVKQLYYGVLLGKETIKLLNEAVEKLGNRIVQEDAAETPVMDPYELLQLKNFEVELEKRLEEAQQNVDLAYEGLRIQLNLEPGAAIELNTDSIKPELASLDQEQRFVDTGLTVQPDSRLLEIGVETKRRLYRLEKYKLFPKLGFGFFVDVGRAMGEIKGVVYKDDYNDPFNYTRAGLGLQLSGTLDIHGATGRIRKARAEYYKAMYEKLIARRAMALDIRKAYLEAKRAQENVKRAKKSQSLANQMMFFSKLNADIGIAEQSRYIDSLKLLLLTRGQYFRAVFDYNMALADLEQRVGERYAEVVPRPEMDEYEAFETNGDEGEGFVTFEEPKTGAQEEGRYEQIDVNQ